ncbi:MAG: glycosyltransferase family 2 protein [Vicinamibacterales bacterium]
MNAGCFTDVALQARFDEVVRHHVATDVTVVIAAKQEAPSLGRVIDRARAFASTIVVAVGRSTDGTAEVAASRGALVIDDRGRGKGDALRCAIPRVETPVTVFLDADGSHDPEDIPLLVGPILADEADHVTASRLKGGSSELHGGFERILPSGRQLVHHRLHQLAIWLPVERQPERLPRRSHLYPETARPARGHDDYRAGDDHEDAARRLAHGRSSEP